MRSFDLLLEENLGISTVGLGTNAQTLYAFVSHPAGMIASDAILFGEYPNPRSYGCFPIVLAEFVRRRKATKAARSHSQNDVVPGAAPSACPTAAYCAMVSRPTL